MGAQEQFHLKIKAFLSEKILVFKVIGKSRQQDNARHEVNEIQFQLSVSSRVSSCTGKNTFGSNRLVLKNVMWLSRECN